MCGIAGACRLAPHASARADVVLRMTRLLAHRGPDGEGEWRSADGRVAFGHRRLSVIDLTTGAQPMSDPSGRFTLIFNGEIYNYRELRESLVADGAVFRTTSDTEVLLALLARHWTEALPLLTGMFAFAVWDALRGELLLARDRIGEKPLYYTTSGDCLYFASSFGAIRQVHDRLVPDPQGVDEFLTLGYVPAPRSIAAGISKLPAGTLLRVSGGAQRLETYWRMGDGHQPFEGTYAQAADTLDDMVSEAVRIRLRSDVPLGVFLSGGVDSSLVAALAARHTAGPILTFSIGFDEVEYDESGVAAEVSSRLGAEHRVFHARYDIVQLLPQLVAHYGEPFGDPSALPVWMLAQETSRHVTVSLGGDGGDEGFAGYDWYHTAARLRRLRQVVPPPAALLGARIVNGITTRPTRTLSRLHRGLALAAAGDAGGFAVQRSFLDEREAVRLYQGGLADMHHAHGNAACDRLASLYTTGDGTHLRRMRLVDIETYLADCLLPKVDVATMAHGLEARAPLLDHDLLRFALSLPDAWLVNGAGGKHILKDVLYRYLPRSLFDRPKQGFGVPLKQWFNGALRDRVQALPDSEALAELGWIRSRGMRDLVAEHRAGYRDHSQRVYNLIVLEQWLTQNV